MFKTVEPFEKKIQPEEIWRYRYPVTSSYVPNNYLWPVLFGIPIASILIFYKLNNERTDVQEALLSFTLTMSLTAIVTDVLKLVSGNLRPDFFWRCFPDGKITENLICTGKKLPIIEGRKSFPSGHASMSFASFGFLFLYLIAKLQIFNENGRGQGWRIVLCLLPILFAMLIAISRICDYHHHGKDVLAGSLLGQFFSYFCYRQYYPSVEQSDLSYYAIKQLHQQ